MTNLQSLGVFVTERLTLAAQEIFKAVEETVTQYHQEISRSRQENELLKRRLLEAGIDFYTEMQSGLSVIQEGEAGAGHLVSGEHWGQQSEEIQVKLELSATQENTQDSLSPQITMERESISPKLCLQKKIEEKFHAQTSESSVDALLHAGHFMQIKEEPSDPVPDLRSETFCDSQITISADPSGAVASGHCSGLEDELDSRRLTSVHKAARSKMPLSNKEKSARELINEAATRDAYLAKRTESYQGKKRERKIVKTPISQLSRTDQEKLRQQWRQDQRKHRERKRTLEKILNFTPNSAGSRKYVHMTPF